MNRRSEILLKSFLSEVPEERRRKLLSFFPAAKREEIEALPTAQKEPDLHSLFEHVHWSWFLPTLQTYQEAEQRLFLSSLADGAKEHLAEQLRLPSSPSFPLSASAKAFFQKTLLSSLTGARLHLIPMDYLPPSPLNKLLRLSKKELVSLIDRLSLFELASEMRQIVETKILKRIYSLLTGEEKIFLKAALARKEPFPTSRIGLDKWDGEEDLFRHQLHKKGLARLGTALSKQEPDLVWYVCHQLDIGRGNALFKLAAKESLSGQSEWMARQIEELLHA